MVQTKSNQASTASRTKVVKTKGSAESTSKKATAKNGAAVPEKRKQDDDKEEQTRPSKTAKDDGENEVTNGESTSNIESTVAHKIRKTIDEYGTVPLEGLAVDKPLEPSPEILLAIVIDSMLKSTRISHSLAQEASIAVFEAGFYDIKILSNTSWDDRVQVLAEGGYNRYREMTATKLGDLATLVNNKYGMYVLFENDQFQTTSIQHNAPIDNLHLLFINLISDGDLNNLLAKVGNNPSQIRQLIREIKGFGDVATDLFCDDAQAVWPVLAPTTDHRSLNTADEVGIGRDIEAIYSALDRDPVQMSRLDRGLSAVRLSRSQVDIEQQE